MYNEEAGELIVMHVADVRIHRLNLARTVRCDVSMQEGLVTFIVDLPPCELRAGGQAEGHCDLFNSLCLVSFSLSHSFTVDSTTNPHSPTHTL